jgi:hypothetical protein
VFKFVNDEHFVTTFIKEINSSLLVSQPAGETSWGFSLCHLQIVLSIGKFHTIQEHSLIILFLHKLQDAAYFMDQKGSQAEVISGSLNQILYPESISCLKSSEGQVLEQVAISQFEGQLQNQDSGSSGGGRRVCYR